jgi:hypothetical protein
LVYVQFRVSDIITTKNLWEEETIAVSDIILALVGAGMVSSGVGVGLYLWNKQRKKQEYQKRWEEPTYQEVKKEDIRGKVAYTIEQQKDERTVIAKKGKASPKKGYVDAKIEGAKRRFYANHIIEERKGKQVRRYIRWNAYYSEAYDINGEIRYDSSLENQLMDDMENQLGKAVGAAVGFVFERPMMYVMAIAFLVSIPIGFPFNDIFHWLPNTIVHWVPRT